MKQSEIKHIIELATAEGNEKQVVVGDKYVYIVFKYPCGATGVVRHKRETAELVFDGR